MKKYILFGAGEKGRNALRFLGSHAVKCFCENSEHENGDSMEGIPIIAARNLKDYLDDETEVVITTIKPRNIYEISKQLNEMDVKFDLFENIAYICLGKDVQLYQSKNQRSSFDYQKEREYLISWDRHDNAGSVSSYFWQDLWAAKRIFQKPVDVHYDIGSRLDGFIAHLLSFGQKVCMIDIRELPQSICGLDFVNADATDLSTIQDNSIESLSALCSLEHFGLGRYGDPIDPEACFKCFEAIQKKMKCGGNLYLSVPIGKECVCFNAHRVFYVETILNEFKDMELQELSVCFKDEYIENVKDYHRFDDWYDHEGDRMGLFWLKKRYRNGL